MSSQIPDAAAAAGCERPSDAAVAEELTRVLASRTLRGARRSRELLAYVVTETLAGRGGRLSERTVGRHGLGHGDHFDGRTDASVRVQASRVRKALQQYYATEGVADGVQIMLPSGAYVPAFAYRSVGEGAEDELDAAVAVLLPDDAAGEDVQKALDRAIAEAIVGRLAAFPGLRVVGPARSREVDPRRIGRELGTRFVLQGSARSRDQGLRLSARLTDARDGRVVWSVTESASGDDLVEAADRWAGAVAGELGDYSGVLFRVVHDAEPSPSSAELAARLAFARYMEEGSPGSLAAARDVIERAMADGYRSSVLLGMAASVLAVQVADGYSQDPTNLERAERYAREALALNPRSGHAHCALGTIAMPRDQPELAVHHGRQAFAFNPDHPSIAATAGMLVAYGGEWDEGIAIFRRALALQPGHPGQWHAVLAADRLMAGDDAGALAEASMIPDSGVPWGYLRRALALAGLGHLDQAQQEFDQVLRMAPDFLDDPYTSMGGNRLLSRERLAPLLERVQLVVADRRVRGLPLRG